MIPQYSIQEWHEQVPWNTDAMVEQDLIICRALISIFNDEFLASQLAFRGGTALHKIYLQPQPRYSEDIDLVQITPGPIKPIMFRFVVGRAPSYKEFVQNMNEKMQDDEFLTDVEPLLRHEVAFNPQEAYQYLYDKVIEKMIVPAT
jgi:hypothetical protein